MRLLGNIWMGVEASAENRKLVGAWGDNMRPEDKVLTTRTMQLSLLVTMTPSPSIIRTVVAGIMLGLLRGICRSLCWRRCVGNELSLA